MGMRVSFYLASQQGFPVIWRLHAGEMGVKWEFHTMVGHREGS